MRPSARTRVALGYRFNAEDDTDDLKVSLLFGEWEGVAMTGGVFKFIFEGEFFDCFDS